MTRTRIKFCGITRPEDARTAAEIGADAIGMVFHPPARRNISLETARQILAALSPFVTPVALFVDAPVERVLEITTELRLRHVQLHGHENPEYVAQLPGLSIIKAIRVDPATFGRQLQDWRNAIARLSLTNLHGLVLETHTHAVGGSGVENDWQTIRQHRDAGDFDHLPSLIAAGGLSPDNVAHVVRTIRPYAVDVSSGIESTPTVKSPEKMRAFVQAVRNAE